MENNFNWASPIIIGYAPNTMYVCKNEGIIVKNVDGFNVDWHVQDFTTIDKKATEKIQSILN